LLDSLKERGVKATFFMNGHAILEHCIYDYAPIVQRAFKEGHHIASHTWSHPHLPQVSEEEVIYQIEQLETAFTKILGVVPTYFRPPFGERGEVVQQVLRKKGYKMIIWDLDTNDFKGDSQLAFDLYNSQINQSPQPTPHIILNHDVIEHTSTTLGPFEVDDALKRGYKVTTVGECIGKDEDDWYKKVGEPEEPNDTWICTPEDMHLPPDPSTSL
jgi:peptidoglycan/xylan/chitin deacetylase (PgdA/CDA1 family)